MVEGNEQLTHWVSPPPDCCSALLAEIDVSATTLDANNDMPQHDSLLGEAMGARVNE